MRSCPTCGAEVREAQKFCAECGYRLVAPKTRLGGLSNAAQGRFAEGIRLGDRVNEAELSDSGADNAADEQAPAPVPARRATEGYRFNASTPRTNDELADDDALAVGDADDFFSRYRRKGTAAESFDLNGDPHKDLPQEVPMTRRSRRRFNPDLTTISPMEQAAAQNAAPAEEVAPAAESVNQTDASVDAPNEQREPATKQLPVQDAAPEQAEERESAPAAPTSTPAPAAEPAAEPAARRATTPDAAIPPRMGDRESKRPSWVAAAAAAGAAGGAAGAAARDEAKPAAEDQAPGAQAAAQQAPAAPKGEPKVYASEPIMLGDLLDEDDDAFETDDADKQLPETKAAEVVTDAPRDEAAQDDAEADEADAADEPEVSEDAAQIAPSARVPMWFNDLFDEPGPDATGVAPRLKQDEPADAVEDDAPEAEEAQAPAAEPAAEEAAELVGDATVPPTSVLPTVSDEAAAAPRVEDTDDAGQPQLAAGAALAGAGAVAGVAAAASFDDDEDDEEWLPSWLQDHAEPQPAKPVSARTAPGTGAVTEDKQALAEWARGGATPETQAAAPAAAAASEPAGTLHEDAAPATQHSAEPLLPPMAAAPAGSVTGPRRSSFDDLMDSEDEDAPILGFDFEQTGMIPRDALQNAGGPAPERPHSDDRAESETPWARPAQAAAGATAGATALGAAAAAADSDQARAPRPPRPAAASSRPARANAAPAPAASAPANRGPRAATAPAAAPGGGQNGGQDRIGAMLASLDRPDRKRLLTILVAAAGSLLLVLSAVIIGGAIGNRQAPVAAPSQTAAPAAPAETPTPTETTPPPLVADPNFETVSFYSPTQKMVCQISGDIGVVCQQWDYNYEKPGEVCDPDNLLGTVVGLTSNGVSYPCIPASLYGNVTVNPGDTFEAGEFSCHLSDTTGMRCVNKAGDAFVLDRNNGLMTGGRMEEAQPTPGATPNN